MKRIVLCLLILMPFGTQAQYDLSGLINSSEFQTSEKAIQAKVDFHISDLSQRKAGKSEMKFLEQVFSQTHRKLLKSYVPYTQFNELIETGRYDCLSATALFDVILDRLGFEHKIIETNYHIFLIVETAEGQVLLETTDRFNGFVSSPQKIASRIESYRQNRLTVSSDQKYYTFQVNIYQEVSPKKLVGLLYFNQAVRSYNNQQWIDCGEKLDNAIALYETTRAAELAVILVHSVNASSLSFETKQLIAARYQKYLDAVKPVLASR
jgi:hypothetical protein